MTTAEKIDLCRPIVNPGVTKLVLTETRSNWCCFWANGFHGIGSLPHVEMTAEREKRRYVRVVHSAEKGVESTQVIHLSFVDGSELERIVYVQNEGGWRFFEYGDPLPFENPDTYTAKRKRDRLTLAMLGSYCGELGIDLLNPDFYLGECALIDYPPLPKTPPVSS